MSKAQELLERLAQIVMVAKCKCSIQRSKSMTHVECLHIDTWIVEELVTAVEISQQPAFNFESPADSISYAESLDSLRPCQRYPY
ncbi:unnamed protein product [Caenorhabditis bovis]|uniref:Uncharacterized protein n=1 Tax=Caenorhabditis bovis TaxID=2654633 RepID=A0A8S1EFV0_9PELO|nr:unnamed protein product [Caenorhabditis bovis]